VGEIILLDGPNIPTLGDVSSHSAMGFANNGLSTTFEQSQETDEVTLVLTANAYGIWANAETLTTGQFAVGLDPDGDGIGNVFEYLFDTDPLVDNQSSFPSIESGLTFDYTRDIVASGNVEQIFQYSTDLEIWVDVAVEDSHPDITITPDPGSGTENIVIDLQTIDGTNVRKFGRLKVELTE